MANGKEGIEGDVKGLRGKIKRTREGEEKGK